MVKHPVRDSSTQEEKVECLFVLNHDYLKQQSQIRKCHVMFYLDPGETLLYSEVIPTLSPINVAKCNTVGW